MRQLLACLSLFFFLSASSAPLAASDRIDVKAHNQEILHPQIDRRIDRLDLPVATVTSDRHLHRKLNDYLNGHRHTELMLGRAQQFFPVFEQALCAYDLPEELKYLAVVESMLRPRARSGAGAAGLWQLMPTTARAYGLRVDYLVDERLDAYKSSDAAARLLRDLYDQYGNWHLAVAAYNSGTANVSRAVRRSGGSGDYRRVRRYLPRETRDYVGAYVAAAYTLNYYEKHGLSATTQRSVDVATARIHRRYSLKQLARLAGCDLRTLKELNPALVHDVTPNSQRGYALNLPAARKASLQTALWNKSTLVESDEFAELAEKRALARVQGFVASRWLVGCENVLNQPANPAFDQKAGEWSKAFLERSNLIAMR